MKELRSHEFKPDIVPEMMPGPTVHRALRGERDLGCGASLRGIHHQSVLYTVIQVLGANYRKSILKLRTSVLGWLRDLQYICAVIYETLCIY